MGNIFDSIDDFMFPVTHQGRIQAGMVLESATEKKEAKAEDDGISEVARNTARAGAMSALLSWIDEGEYTYQALDEIVVVVSDLDGDFEISEEEEEEYNHIWAEMGDALLSLGADAKDAQALVDGPGKEADDAAARIGKALSEGMDEERADDDSLISGFALGEDAVLESVSDDEVLHGILEATYKRKKVIRDGQVQVVRKRLSGKVRLSATQKSGLRKARRKAHTAAANLKRRKSMRMRKNRGL